MKTIELNYKSHKTLITELRKQLVEAQTEYATQRIHDLSEVKIRVSLRDLRHILKEVENVDCVQNGDTLSVSVFGIEHTTMPVPL